MKKIRIILIISGIFISIFTLKSQTACVTCSTNPVGSGASNIGPNSTADGPGSVALGTSSHTSGINSISIGTNINTIGGLSFVIGTGVNPSNMLTNSISKSLMVGFYSDVPTLFVGSSGGIGKTGRIGIGNIVDPEVKLHLYADDGEDAAVFIQPHNWANDEYAILMLGTQNTGIAANKMNGLNFLSEGNYLFNSGGFVGINTAKPEYNLHVNGSTFTKAFRLYDEHLPTRAGNVLISDDIGNAYWADPNEYSLWKLSENGTDIYRTVGNVGIGTTNTGEYKLAVNGNMVAESIKVVGDVPASDYVFQEDYKLMTLYELEKFVAKNHHLPEVKSAQEFKDEGYNIGEMDDVLLRKVEELTLYTIEQQKQLDEQKKLVELLMKQITNLEEKLNQNVN